MNWNVTSQEAMEQGLRGYFATLSTTQAGTFNAMLNPQLVACSYAEKTLEISVRAERWMVNPADILHGGITASLLDFAMGLLSRCCSGGNLTPTISMTVDYIRSMKAGQTLIVRAECSKCGSNLSYLTARAWSEGQPEKTIASASGTYFTGGKG